MTLKEFILFALTPFNILAKLIAEIVSTALSLAISAIILALLAGLVGILALPLAIGIGIGLVTHSSRTHSFLQKTALFLLGTVGLLLLTALAAVVVLAPLTIGVLLSSAASVANTIIKTLCGKSRSWSDIGKDYKTSLSISLGLCVVVYHGLRTLGRWIARKPFAEALAEESVAALQTLTYFGMTHIAWHDFELNPANFLQGRHDNEMNYSQSVHRASVEQGVQDALKVFQKKYPLVMQNKQKREELLKELKKFQEEIIPTSTCEACKKVSATNCINRILNPNDDNMKLPPIPGSAVTPRDAILMVFQHMQDPKSWLPGITQEAVHDAFIDALWHIQRAKYINDKGKDTKPHLEDDPSCPGGSINILVNNMQTVLQNITVNFITENTAINKLTAMTRIKILEMMKDDQESKLGDEKDSPIAFDSLPTEQQELIKTAAKADFLNEEKIYTEYLGEAAVNKAFEGFEKNVLPYIDVSADQRIRFFAAPPKSPVVSEKMTSIDDSPGMRV